MCVDVDFKIVIFRVLVLGVNGHLDLCKKVLNFAYVCVLFFFVFLSSLYFDEDGDLAHEFYEETVVTKNGRKKAKLKRIHKNLIPQVSQHGNVLITFSTCFH